MRTTRREAPGRPDRGLFGIVPPGRPTDLAVVVLVGVLQLALQVPPERLGQGLTDVGASGDGLREHRLGVGDGESQDHRGPADRGWSEHAQLGELVGQVQQAVADA